MNSKLYYYGFTFLIWLSCGCAATAFHKQDGYVYLQNVDRNNSSQWKLVWQDDFDGIAIDTSKWSKIPKGQSDWNKHMSNNPDCYAVYNGHLYLRGIVNKDTLKDERPYLTGGVYSKNKFAFQYGKIEIRAKLECARGAWPAMWMLAEKNKYGAYPRNGEIDIMEHLNFDHIIYQTTHSYYTLDLKQKDNPQHGGTAPIDITQYNIFGLEWFADKLVFTLNGQPTFTYPKTSGVDASQWPYDQPFYIMIDQQLGGGWVGKVHPDDLPVQMIVDWVKIYQ